MNYYEIIDELNITARAYMAEEHYLEWAEYTHAAYLLEEIVDSGPEVSAQTIIRALAIRAGKLLERVMHSG